MIAPPPPPPLMPRLMEDVVPDDRDDPEIILNTTTVSPTYSSIKHITYLAIFSLTYHSLSPAVLLLSAYLRRTRAKWGVGGLGDPGFPYVRPKL